MLQLKDFQNHKDFNNQLTNYKDLVRNQIIIKVLLKFLQVFLKYYFYETPIILNFKEQISFKNKPIWDLVINILMFKRNHEKNFYLCFVKNLTVFCVVISVYYLL